MSIRTVGKLTTQDIVKILSEELGLTGRTATQAVSLVFQSIASAAADGRPCAITNFGAFHPHEVEQRTHNNLSHREASTVPAHQTIRFRPADRLREIVHARDATGSIRKRPSGRTAGIRSPQ